MAVHASHAALPYPIKNARFSLLVPYLDADGDPTAPTTPDTEISKDNAAAADCAEEVSATSGMDGMALLTLSGAETDCSCAALNAKVASGPKATLATLYPRVLASVGTGTLSAGSAGGGTLGTLLAYDVTGCFIKTTGGTGGGGTGGANNQVRKIITYNTGTGAFTVAPNWETTPSTDTTYDVLLPDGVTLSMLRALNPTTAGRTLDVSAGGEAGVDWANVGSPSTTVSLSATTVGTVNALSASANNGIADQVWDEATSGHVASGSFGQAHNIIRAATAQAGASTTITLDASASATDDFYNNQRIFITAGTGAGQGRIISDYTGATKVATVPTWATNPSSDSVFVILPFGSIPGASAPTAGEVADAVWDEARTDHTAAGSFGQSAQIIRSGTAQAGGASSITLDASASATNDLYNYSVITIIGGTGAGQSRQITDYVGSSKVATVGLAWATQPSSDSVFLITPLGVDAATVAAIADAVWDEARSGHVTAGSFGEYVPADATRLSGDATAADNAEAFFDGTGYAGTNNVIPTVTAVTTVNGLAANSVTAAAVAADAVTEIQSGLATASALSTVSTNVDAILADTGTDGVVVATASKSGYALSNAGVDALYTRQLTEAYAADGAAPTVAQALMQIQQMLTEFAISSTTMTVKKLDGTTTAFTLTLDSASAPTSVTRAT